MLGSSWTSPPQNHSTTSLTIDLHDPHPIPARVASITALVLRLPAATQAPIALLVTPLQLHTCASAGNSSSVILALGVPKSNNSDKRSSGSGESLSKACIR